MKNNVPFRSCISKINNTFTDNVDDMPLYNLLGNSDNSMTSESLSNYYRDEINDDKDENESANNRINN